MKKGKRILAIIGIVILVGLYVTTLIASIIQTEFAQSLFFASLYCTFIVPIVIYGYEMIYKIVKGNKVVPPIEEAKDKDESSN